MKEGEVTFFHDDGGYGFIESDEMDDEDVYFHMANIEGPDLEEGQVVRFEHEDAEQGPKVVSLERVEDNEEVEE